MTTVLEQKADIPAMSFLGFIHEGVPCTRANLPDCVAFYIDVLGLHKLPRPKALEDTVPGAWLGDADNKVQFHLIAKDDEHIPGVGAAATPAGRHTAWMVKDIAAFKARMEGLGVHYSETGSIIGAPQVFVVDPSGHTWEFQEPAKR
jgi:catechol 2,3-dioxygenase-like lactoylglutathione lyase family enzyme